MENTCKSEGHYKLLSVLESFSCELKSRCLRKDKRETWDKHGIREKCIAKNTTKTTKADAFLGTLFESKPEEDIIITCLESMLGRVTLSMIY